MSLKVTRRWSIIIKVPDGANGATGGVDAKVLQEQLIIATRFYSN